MDESVPPKRRKEEWSLQAWPFSKEVVYPSRTIHDWRVCRSPKDLVAQPQDVPEPSTSSNPIPEQNQRFLRREDDSSTVWLRWEGETVSSSLSLTPSLNQSEDGLGAGCLVRDIRRESEPLVSRSTDARRMSILTHGNPDYDFTPSGGIPVLWEGAVVMLDGSIISVTAHQVSREFENPNPNISKVMEQDGEILLGPCWSYIMDTARSSEKRVTIHQILPREKRGEANFARLFSRLYSRTCAAIIRPMCRAITDAYVIPLGPEDAVPPCVPVVEGLESRAYTLLAVVIRNRQRKRPKNGGHSSSAGEGAEDGLDHSIKRSKEERSRGRLLDNSNSTEREVGVFLESLWIQPPGDNGNVSKDGGEDDDSSTIELEEVIKREALYLYDQGTDEIGESPSQYNDNPTRMKEEDEPEGSAGTSRGKDSPQSPGCSVAPFQKPFEEFIAFLTSEMKVDPAVATKRANDAFVTLDAAGLGFDSLKSFTAHHLEYGLCFSLGDATRAMRNLFKSRGIINMWTIEGLLRTLAAYYFRVLGVVLKEGLVWKDPNQLEVDNSGWIGGRGLLDNITGIEDEILSTDPDYIANRLEAEESIFGGNRRVGLVVETVPMVLKGRSKRPSLVVILQDSGAERTYCSWSCAYHHSTYVIKLRKPCAVVSINGSTQVRTAARLHILTNQGICSFWSLILEDIPIIHYPSEVLIPSTILEKYRLTETYFDRLSTEPCSLIVGMDMAAKLHPREVERTEEIILYVSQITGRFLATGARSRHQRSGYATMTNILQDEVWDGPMDVEPRQLQVRGEPPQSCIGEARGIEISAGSRCPRGYGINEDMRNFYNNSARYGSFWEFVRDLLRMEEFNPSILKWEHQETGLFRVVSKAGLGKLWSLVKGNLTTSYNRVLMVLREYRGQRKIDIVDSTKLLYRFGPRAKGWDRRSDEYGGLVRLVGQRVRCMKCLCLFANYLQLENHRRWLCAGRLVPPLKAGWSLVPEGKQRPGDWERLGYFYREDSSEYEPPLALPGGVGTIQQKNHAAALSGSATSFPNPGGNHDIDLDCLDSRNYMGPGGTRQGSANLGGVIVIDDVPSPSPQPVNGAEVARPSLQPVGDLVYDLPIDLSRKSERGEDAALSLLDAIAPPRGEGREKPEYNQRSGEIASFPTGGGRPVVLGARGGCREKVMANPSHGGMRRSLEERVRSGGETRADFSFRQMMVESAKNIKCFLRSILCHHSTNPSVIKWSTYEEDAFRIASWPGIFGSWKRLTGVDIEFEVFMGIIENCIRIGSISPIQGRPRHYRFGRQRKSAKSGDSRPRLDQGLTIVIPECAPSNERRGDPSTGSGFLENFGEMILTHSGFPGDPASKIKDSKEDQSGLRLEQNQKEQNELVRTMPMVPPKKRRRSYTKARENKNPSEKVPRAILPRLPGVVEGVEEQFVEYSARILMPMDTSKKVHLTVGNMTIDLEPSPFSHFPRTGCGQPRWVLAPPLVATTDQVPLVSQERGASEPQDEEIVPEKSELTGDSLVVQGASLLGLGESKEVEISTEDAPAYVGALEPKPELPLARLDIGESSAIAVPDYCQEVEVKNEGWERLPYHPVKPEDQFWNGLVTTHFETKEGILEEPGKDLKPRRDSVVVRLPKVNLSAEAEESILDHPRLV